MSGKRVSSRKFLSRRGADFFLFRLHLFKSLVSTPFSTEENGARNQGIARAFCRMLVRFLPPMSVNKETSCGKIPGFHCELKKLEERTSNDIRRKVVI